ncbi:MAG: U32 family peptidase, partial [Lachnospiraceae bacterium]|nr:U32 family peptidase [Lachnospiraceae bacterium]
YAGDDIFVPVSSVNNLRRSAIEMLKGEILKRYRRVSAADDRDKKRGCVARKGSLGFARDDIKMTGDDIKMTGDDINKGRVVGNVIEKGNGANESILIHCRIDKPEMLDDILEYDFVDIVSMDISEFTGMKQSEAGPVFRYRELRETAEMISGSRKSFYLILPTVIRDGYFERQRELDELLRSGIADGVIIDNYESLYYLKSIGYKGEILSDIHLYAFNDEACAKLAEYGVSMITCPVELNERELKRLDMKRGEFIIYGRLPMMISAGCTALTLNGCKADKGASIITDRLGNDFPVIRNCRECINTILNCVPMMFSPGKIPEMAGIASYRIHFTTEDRDQIRRIMGYYSEALRGMEPGMPDIKYTHGHYKRGVE